MWASIHTEEIEMHMLDAMNNKLTKCGISKLSMGAIKEGVKRGAKRIAYGRAGARAREFAIEHAKNAKAALHSAKGLTDEIRIGYGKLRPNQITRLDSAKKYANLQELVSRRLADEHGAIARAALKHRAKKAAIGTGVAATGYTGYKTIRHARKKKVKKDLSDLDVIKLNVRALKEAVKRGSLKAKKLLVRGKRAIKRQTPKGLAQRARNVRRKAEKVAEKAEILYNPKDYVGGRHKGAFVNVPFMETQRLSNKSRALRMKANRATNRKINMERAGNIVLVGGGGVAIGVGAKKMFNRRKRKR